MARGEKAAAADVVPREPGPRMLVVLTEQDFAQIIRDELKRALAGREKPSARRLTVREAAPLIPCCERHLRQLIADREINVIRTGRKLLIESTEIDRYISEARA
jgi:excisionase family DNA binding protein